MATKTINVDILAKMFLAGAQNIEAKKDYINELNVFPVPDGDTGTNMSMTIMSAAKEVTALNKPAMKDLAKAISSGSLRGARGNSGVILSQLLRGFTKAIKEEKEIDVLALAAACQRARDTAYKAVMKPKEGTILTVARVIAEEAVKQAERTPDDYDALFTNILSTGEVILKKTQQMLPALTQAGVVDAGGRGLLYIYMGYAAVLRGEELPSDDEAEGAEGDSYEDEHSLTGELKYIYCTEFGVENLFPDIVEEDIDSLRRRLNRIGDCVRVTGDLSAVKVHVHTNEPAKALEFGLSLGELIDLKIENMAQKRREAQPKEEPQAAPQPAAQQEPPKESGMVAVSLGEGFNQIFRDLTVDQVVEGGQTMNPSIEDISEAVGRVNAKVVYVLPNNGNVILAAQQAAELCEDKKVVVIPTKNVAMGIAAAIACQPELSPEQNAARMEEAAQRVRTGTVTYAVRDTDLDDLHIHQGDIIGLYNGKIQTVGNDVQDVTLRLMEAIVTDEDELITVYYGKDTKEDDAQALTDELASRYGDCDVEMQMGGQPLYYYLVSVE